MILLLLIDLGAASVKAQVRIGGNAAPNAAAVLDLNANNNANPAGNKGLGLPRVTLANDTTMLTPGVANLNGMMVCNTTNTLGGAGLYYWSANSAKWVKVNLPPTSAGDSGKILMSDGNTWISVFPSSYRKAGFVDTVALLSPTVPITWTLIVDTIFVLPNGILINEWFAINVPGILAKDRCFQDYTPLTYPGLMQAGTFAFHAGTSFVEGYNLIPRNLGPFYGRLRCYRPSA